MIKDTFKTATNSKEKYYNNTDKSYNRPGTPITTLTPKLDMLPATTPITYIVELNYERSTVSTKESALRVTMLERTSNVYKPPIPKPTTTQTNINPSPNNNKQATQPTPLQTATLHIPKISKTYGGTWNI